MRAPRAARDHARSRARRRRCGRLERRPAGPALDLVTDKPVFKSQDVMGKIVFVKEVAKPVVKLVVLIVSHLEQTVLNALGRPFQRVEDGLRNALRSSVEDGLLRASLRTVCRSTR